MKSALRYTAINLAVLLGLLLVLNIGAIALYQGLQAWRAVTNPEELSDARARLPNYQGLEWAEAHFEELKRAGVEYHSFYGWRRKPFSGSTIIVDERGIRPTPGSASPEHDAPFVVFLGGSTMWGEGANNESTIPAYFVRQAGRPTRVENLGESAYNAFQGYLFLRFKILEGWKPDLVISYDGINNVGGLCRSANRATGHGRELQMRNAMRGLDQVRTPEALTGWYFVLPLKELLARFIKRADPNWVDPYRAVCAEDPDRAQAVAKSLLDSWLTTMEMVKGYGGQFVAVLQPAAYLGTPTTDHLALDPKIKLEYDAVYGRVYDMLDETRYAELRPHVLDLTDALDGSAYVYIDSGHLSPQGNERIARRLLQARIIQLGLELHR